jgi:hypothetical protein
LLVEDFDNRDLLEVYCRATADREVGVSHRRSGTVLGKALATRNFAYDPDVRIPGKPYRSILAYPILVEKEASVRAVGGISIDSSRPHHFDGWEKEIEARILIYLRLLRLVVK